MPETRPTGRTPHETVEIPPTTLDCGHPCGPGRVIIGFHPPGPNQPSRRSYYCRECGVTTYVD